MISNPINPELAAFMQGFMPRFVDPAHGAVAVQPLVLGAVRKVCGLCAPGTEAPVSGTLGGPLARRPGPTAWRERSTGAVMVALGPRLLLAGDARAARGWPWRSGRRVGYPVIGGP